MAAPRRALIVIDVQQEYFDGTLQIQAPPREESLANITRTIGVATQQDLPVVVVQHQSPADAPVFAEGSHSWSLHPEIEKPPSQPRSGSSSTRPASSLAPTSLLG